MILIDTSVYIEVLTDKDIEILLTKAGKISFIMSSEVVQKEINEAVTFLRRKGKRNDAERLKELYESTISGTIRLTDRVVDVGNRYAEEVRKKFSKDKSKTMKDDFRIVASASVGGIGHIATFNRKTMANTEIVELYKNVNSKEKLKTPRFIKSKEELSGFLSSG